jgi:hypothetical protein
MNILRYNDFINENIDFSVVDPYGEERWDDLDDFDDLTKIIEKMVEHYNRKFNNIIALEKIPMGGYGGRSLRVKMKGYDAINIDLLAGVYNTVAIAAGTSKDLSGHRHMDYYNFEDSIKPIRRKFLEMGKAIVDAPPYEEYIKKFIKKK